MTNYRIGIEWTDKVEDTGLTVAAVDEEGAIVAAVRTGIVSGLGRNPRYVGVIATPVEA